MKVRLWHGAPAKWLEAYRTGRLKTLVPVARQTRSMLEPVAGRIYGSPRWQEARTYAGRWERRPGALGREFVTGAMVLIEGADPWPDEDWVGMLLVAFREERLSGRSPWHVQWVQASARTWWGRFGPAWQEWARAAWFVLPERTRGAIDRVVFRGRSSDYASWSEVGKRVLGALARRAPERIEEAAALVLAGAPAFDGGVTEAYKLSVRADTVRIVEVVENPPGLHQPRRHKTGRAARKRAAWEAVPPPGAAEAALALAQTLTAEQNKVLEAAGYDWENIGPFWAFVEDRYEALGCGGTRCAVVAPGGWYVVKLPVSAEGMDANEREGIRAQDVGLRAYPYIVAPEFWDPMFVVQRRVAPLTSSRRGIERPGNPRGMRWGSRAHKRWLHAIAAVAADEAFEGVDDLDFPSNWGRIGDRPVLLDFGWIA